MNCFAGIGLDGGRILLSSASFAIAVTLLIAIKKSRLAKLRIAFIYLHLTALFFPFFLLTTNIACGALCMPCYNNTLHLISYALPATLAFSTLAGFVLIPALYIYSNRQREIRNKAITGFVRRYSRILRIRRPGIYATDSTKPVAFSFRSFRSAIFLSVRLLEILNGKEAEAILLHELAHIKQRASAVKLSRIFMNVFSPLSFFAVPHDSLEEEKDADRLAASVQGTRKHILSAKKKIREFEHTQA